MGQSVAAIVYGVFLTKEQGDALRDDGGEWREPFPDCGHVETGYEGRDFIGFAVAVQNVADSDEDDIQDCRVSEIETVHSKRIAGAKKKWRRLASWAKNLDVTLDDPCLLLVTVERA